MFALAQKGLGSLEHACRLGAITIQKISGNRQLEMAEPGTPPEDGHRDTGPLLIPLGAGRGRLDYRRFDQHGRGHRRAMTSGLGKRHEIRRHLH